MTRPAETFFTSDLHFSHDKVADLRGFADSAAHDLALMNNWSDVVTDADTVYVLGDLVASPSAPKTRYALAVLASLPGRKHLIAGNHDAVHPMYRKASVPMREYLDVFDTVASAGRVKVAGTNCLLSHFPYVRDRAETRYPQWRLPNLGEWLLHGHTHGTERETVGGVAYRVTDDGMIPWPATREIHVGLDAWGHAPVHRDEVAALIERHTP